MAGSLIQTRRWLAFAAGLLILNFALTFHNIWPTPWITTRHEISIEIVALLLLLVLWERLHRPLTQRALHGVALLLTLMCIGRYAEVTAPALYGRRINLYWDAQHLPAVAAMLVEAASPWLVAAVIVAGVGLLALVLAMLRWSLTQVREVTRSNRGGKVIAVMSSIVIVAYLLGYARLPVSVWSWFSLPVSTTYWRQAEFMWTAATESKQLPPPISMAGPNLDRVRGADLMVMFVESYGAMAYDNPLVATHTAPYRERFANAAQASGRRVASAFVESPTFGGGSWLAHMSFFTGLDVREQGDYNLLLTQSRDSLTRRFKAEGYRVLALMPGLKGAWPEGSFYGFETIYGEAALAYPGPDFGWWRIPDQYSLARLAAIELEPADRPPVFAFFPTISTHMPFRPTPPFQSDWSRLLTETPYAEQSAELAAALDWTDLVPAYAGTLAYTFEYLASFLEERAKDEQVLVLLGDHQPPASVAGAAARWDVPVHIVASQDAVIDALLEAGFVAGLIPEPVAVAPMYELPTILLEAFSTPNAPKTAPTNPDVSVSYDVPR